MEQYVLTVGWAVILGGLLLAGGLMWYYALFWWFNAIKNTAPMAKFLRMYIISKHRERRRQKRKYANNVLLARDSRHE